MFYNNTGAPRQMYEVNEKCAECGTAITSLPFQPSGDKPLYCSQCLRAKRGDRRSAGGFGNRGGMVKKMYDVDLNCADCGAHITQLPFLPKPDSDKPIYCMECNRARRNATR